MRLRFKPYAAPELAACPFTASDPASLKGQWSASFARPNQPLHLELGCGKGGFLAQLALQHPDINYVGIDLTDKVLILAKRNIEALYAQHERPVDHVKILAYNIEQMYLIMNEKDAVSRIYINFCNPWNRKSGQTKHRLTHTRQLLLYREILTQQGEIYFKCDDENLFEDTLSYLPQAGFEITFITRDLHADEPAWNIRTEHETMFTQKGISTKALIAKKVALPLTAPAAPAL